VVAAEAALGRLRRDKASCRSVLPALRRGSTRCGDLGRPRDHACTARADSAAIHEGSPRREFGLRGFSITAAKERRHPAGRKRMHPSTLQTLQEPILRTPRVCMRGAVERGRTEGAAGLASLLLPRDRNLLCTLPVDGRINLVGRTGVALRQGSERVAQWGGEAGGGSMRGALEEVARRLSSSKGLALDSYARAVLAV
jgi:hypothetical protein